MNADLMEVLMIVCFGVAWIFSVIKALKTKSAKGKSILFEILMLCGYGFGVVQKVFLYKDAMTNEKALNFWFYLAWFLGAFIFIVVVFDLILWIRNSFVDRKRDKDEKKLVEGLQSELEQAKSEAEQAKSEAEQTKDDLEQVKGELEQSQNEVEEARNDLEQAKRDAAEIQAASEESVVEEKEETE